MKKIFFLALILTMTTHLNAQASSSPLNEYNWNTPNTNTGSSVRGKTQSPRLVNEFGKPLTGSDGGSEMCLQICQGYSMDITECPDGYDMKTCNAEGCYDYHKCEQSPCALGYDTSLKDCPIAVQPDNYLCTKCK